MALGLKISKPGFNPDNSDPQNLIFDSEKAVPKIIAMGSIALSHTLGETNHTIYTHNLGYIPAYRLYFEFTAGSGDMYGDNNFDNSTSAQWEAKASTTTLEIDVNALPTGTYRIFYIIFADPAKSTSTKLTPSGTQGLIITKPGFDPDTDDLKNFIFHSEYQTPNIIDVVTLTTDVNATVSVAHGLSIRPAWAGLVSFGGSYYDLPYVVPFLAYFEVWVTSTHVFAQLLTPFPDTTVFKIMLFNIDI